ncbi:putative disease resistance RPP13-like protein 1 [Cannabis sativa]|uniref:putative disease resistance RPP13-like protein 1 n=1 Tax=Cannabis sativa TaxID=3483 RepID=UPI0029C9D114|nr:putative disease resistance RPP13-like protein 1 [Cannabis sativa]
MEAAAIGGALLSSFLDVLFNRMASKEVVNFFRGKKLVSKLIKKLKTSLLSAAVLLNDAEEKQLTDSNVKKWLDELKQLLYDADHVMDKIKSEALRVQLEKGETGSSKASKLLSIFPNVFRQFENNVRFELEEILGSLNNLIQQTEFLGLKEVDQKRPSYRLYSPLVEENSVFGRNEEKEAIVKLLLCDDVGDTRYRISVIPIVGMGGVGKTTLAQLVYKERCVQKHFDLKAWVTVSEEFDIFKILKTILESVTLRKCEIRDVHQLQHELSKALTGKKFLFVHDDVWNENYELWDMLKSSFESGAYGSKIIVTTRSKVVALKMGNTPMYDLQTMSDDDCWQLFSRHAFNNLGSNVQMELVDIGKQIVRKCKGLPLAVKSISGLLRSVSNVEEWRTILQSNVWELQFQENQNNNILPALWLSYHFLPRHLKRCFAYFSLFPKDYAFYKSERKTIFLLWMAEGILQPQEGKRMEDVGEEYLNALISRSFFQHSTRDESTLFMHDITHDLAIRVSGEFCFIDHTFEDFNSLTSKTRHLSYMKGFDDLVKLEGSFKAKCLRTFLSLPLSHKNLYSKPRLTQKGAYEWLLNGKGCLRALSLSQSSILELPDSIGNLKHLRYLDLSETKITKLPCSVCSLYNLQTLLLSSCKELTQLPTNTSKLINLRHLMIRDTPLKEMPPQMNNLTNLQGLSDFVLSKNDGSRIKELGALQHLHGSLCIVGLENVRDAMDAKEANLGNKKHLSELILIWDGETDDSIKDREVLDALQPHVNLKKLTIEGYRGTNLPKWVAHPSYCNLAKISLKILTNCCLLPSFSQLVSLRELQIYRFDRFLSIDDKPSSITSLTNPFQCLVTLEVSRMSKWGWSFVDECSVFPCLKKFSLNSCRKLSVGLPPCYLPSLEEITIRKCHDMVQVFPSYPHIDVAYPSLDTLQLSSCSRLKSFSNMGLPSSLKSLDFRDCSALFAKRFDWNLQDASSLVNFTLYGSPFGGNYYDEVDIDSFPEEGLLPSTLRYLNISCFENLKALNNEGFQHLTSFQGLTLQECSQLQCLPNEGLPQTLTSLEIYKCPLLTPRCQRRTGEDWSKIQHVSLIRIDRKEV